VEGPGQELQELGAVGFVQKPISLKQLSHAVSEAMVRQDPDEEAPAS
jgi:FixJ family two-component response regulator